MRFEEIWFFAERVEVFFKLSHGGFHVLAFEGARIPRFQRALLLAVLIAEPSASYRLRGALFFLLPR
jgi:hypothetical protein